MSGKQLSRREFVMGASAGATACLLGSSALAHAQEAPAASGSTTSASSASASGTSAGSGAAAQQELSCDIVILGGGIAGALAAIQATDLGANVVLLEKTEATGVRGGGFFAVSSPLLEEAGVEPVDVPVFFKAFMEDTSWRADGTLVRDWLEMSKSSVSYLMKHGCTFIKTTETLSGGNSYPGGFGFTQYDKDDRDETAQITDALTSVTDAGGQIICEATAREFLYDENGDICGARADLSDGSVLDVKAKSVIMATGGYNADFDWVADSYDGVKPTSNRGLPGNIGEGIKMGMGVGAATRSEQAVMLRMPRLMGDFTDFNNDDRPDGKVKVGKGFQYAMPLLPMGLWVNSAGERFADENEICYNRNYSGNVIMSQGGYVYIVITESMLDTLQNAGASSLGMLQPQGMGYINDYTCMDQGWGDIMSVTNGLIDQGFAFRGDTVDDLAAAASMDAAALGGTVDTYNATCLAGSDDSYFKDPQFLYAMDEGPYYMFTVEEPILCTLGGLRVSRHMEVVSSDGDARTFPPIKNLYACGTCTGGFYGDHYANAEGPAQSFCITSARTAACYAVNNSLGTDYDHLEVSAEDIQ